ncbi:MAG: hypothetical protein ABI212_08475 [Burkholderiaceae bacterium]
MTDASHAAIDDARTKTRADVPTVPNAADKTAVSGAGHDADYPAEEDPIERITRSIPILIPVAGAVLIFLLAFIAVFMA